MNSFQIPFGEALSRLSGFSFWLAFLSLLIWIAVYYYSRSKKKDKSRARRLILLGIVLIIINIVLYFFSHMLVFPWQKFDKNQSGVIILKFAGDDKLNSVRRDLITSLNEKLETQYQRSNEYFISYLPRLYRCCVC